MNDTLKKALHSLEEEARNLDNPAQRAILAVLTDALRSEGEPGLHRITGLLEDILSGRHVPLASISEDLWVASEFLAAMQQIEASKKNLIRQWILLIVQETVAILREVIP